MGSFSRLVTRECVCYEGHVVVCVVFFYGFSILATVCLSVYYSSYNSRTLRVLLLVCLASSQHCIFLERSFD